MKRNNRIRFAATLLVLSLFWLFPSIQGQVANKQKVAVAPADHQAGIIVEEVTKGSEAEKAGLQEGDVLMRWIRGDAKGEIESPFDIAWIEIEQTQRGVVTLEGHPHEVVTATEREDDLGRRWQQRHDAHPCHRTDPAV